MERAQAFGHANAARSYEFTRAHETHSSLAAQVIPGGRETWAQHKDRLSHVLTAALPEYSPMALELSRRILELDTVRSDAQICLLKDQAAEIVGFSMAYPAPINSGASELVQERQDLGLTPEQYKQLAKSTAEFGWTAILPEFRGRGGWSQMMHTMEAQLRLKCESMLRFVRMDNLYHQKMLGHYGDRVMYRKEYFDNAFGWHMMMRVKL